MLHYECVTKCPFGLRTLFVYCSLVRVLAAVRVGQTLCDVYTTSCRCLEQKPHTPLVWVVFWFSLKRSSSVSDFDRDHRASKIRPQDSKGTRHQGNLSAECGGCASILLPFGSLTKITDYSQSGRKWRLSISSFRRVAKRRSPPYCSGIVGYLMVEKTILTFP